MPSSSSTASLRSAIRACTGGRSDWATAAAGYASVVAELQGDGQDDEFAAATTPRSRHEFAQGTGPVATARSFPPCTATSPP